MQNDFNNQQMQQSESEDHQQSLPSINFHERQMEQYISGTAPNRITVSLNINSESLRESDESESRDLTLSRGLSFAEIPRYCQTSQHEPQFSESQVESQDDEMPPEVISVSSQVRIEGNTESLMCLSRKPSIFQTTGPVLQNQLQFDFGQESAIIQQDESAIE